MTNAIYVIYYFRENIPRHELNHMTDPIIPILIDKLNDGTAKIRDSAMRTLKFVAENLPHGASVVGTPCLRAMPAKQKAAWRPLCSRLNLVLEIVNTAGVNNKHGVSVENVIGFMKGAETFTHSNGEVREVTRLCCIAMSKLVGPDAILPHLEPPVLRKTQFDDYTLALTGKSSKPAANTTTSASNASHDDKDKRHAAPDSKHHKSPHKKGKDAPPSEAETASYTTCMFCGVSDPSWNEDSLDLHYWQDCTLLTQCPACGQVTEIAGLPQHLTQECEQKDNYVFDNTTGMHVLYCTVLYNT